LEKQGRIKQMIAPCGHECEDCKVYIATRDKDMEGMKLFSLQLKEQTGKEVRPEDLACEGCLSEGRRLGFCAVCPIRACALSKGYSSCASCPQLPCEKGKFIWVEGSESLRRLKGDKL